MLLHHVRLDAVADTVLSNTRLCACLLIAFWTSSMILFTQLIQHSATAAHGSACCVEKLNTCCVLDSRARELGSCLLCDSISSDGSNSISSSLVNTGWSGKQLSVAAQLQ